MVSGGVYRGPSQRLMEACGSFLMPSGCLLGIPGALWALAVSSSLVHGTLVVIMHPTTFAPHLRAVVADLRIIQKWSNPFGCSHMFAALSRL